MTIAYSLGSVPETSTAAASTSISGAAGCKGTICGEESNLVIGGIRKGAVCGGGSCLESGVIGGRLCKAG